jgi:hypothetical protein
MLPWHIDLVYCTAFKLLITKNSPIAAYCCLLRACHGRNVVVSPARHEHLHAGLVV